jgi:hypothetical protein
MGVFPYLNKDDSVFLPDGLVMLTMNRDICSVLGLVKASRTVRTVSECQQSKVKRCEDELMLSLDPFSL